MKNFVVVIQHARFEMQDSKNIKDDHVRRECGICAVIRVDAFTCSSGRVVPRINILMFPMLMLHARYNTDITNQAKLKRPV